MLKGQECIYISIYIYIKFIDVERNDLIEIFISLSDKTNMDILEFDRRLVSFAGEHIVNSLLCIINDSLLSGTFPDDWKRARVTLVYKNNGDINIVSNYRRNTVIGHIAKMVEQLVRSQLVSYLEERAFISPDLSAYPKGHSTQTSLHRVIDDWLESTNYNQTDHCCLPFRYFKMLWYHQSSHFTPKIKHVWHWKYRIGMVSFLPRQAQTSSIVLQ